MDLLTKYRPLKSLEFYQRKVVRFIHSSESTEDFRTLGISSVLGLLGFDSPLHFIRLIPPEFCQDYAFDKLFQRIDKTLRKGNRVFLISDSDGRIQSAIFKGQKQLSDGKIEAILDGHRQTYPLDNVVPYKAFLRKNIGTLLVDGPHKVVGTNVTYEQCKWDSGDTVYYKPSKRWAIIQRREIVRGKVFCDIKLEGTKLKKEKVMRIQLQELMSESVPYRTPVIPQNNANAQEYNKTNSKTPEQTKITNNVPTPETDNRVNDDELINHNRNEYVSKESETNKEINFKKTLSASESEADTTASSDDSAESSIPPKDVPSIPKEAETVLIDLKDSPGKTKEFKEPDIFLESVVVRRSNSRAMRPLTEYFHSKSVEATEDIFSPGSFQGPDLKMKSLNNLDSQAIEDEEEFTFENYSNSLRRSARNVLAKQLAQEAVARQRTGSTNSIQQKKKASLSTDNLQLIPDFQFGPSPIAHVSVSELQRTNFISSSANDTNDTSGSDSPPPLPASLPPRQQNGDFMYDHTEETAPRNYENSNFTNGSYYNSFPKETTQARPISSSVSSYHQTLPLNSSLVDNFSNQYLHHATSVPSFSVPDTSTSSGRQPRDIVDRKMSVEGQSTLEKRYKKNPGVGKYKELQKVKSVPNFPESNNHSEAAVDEPPLPQPFTIENIQSAIGKGRGIQTGYHSSYADVSLFAMFYCTNIFDKLLNAHLEDRAMTKEVKSIIKNKILKSLRLSAFCGWESVCHLREAMLPLSSKLNSSFMDSEEFLYLLFENALKLPEFLHYSNGTKDFMHQIIVKPKDRSRCQDIQFLFETSMEVNSLKLTQFPQPALLVCMPRCNGRLVYYEAIIPNLRINITSLLQTVPKKCLCELTATLECALCYKAYGGERSLAYCQTCSRMSDQIHRHIGHKPVLVPKFQKDSCLNLLAVICVKHNHYTTFVRTGLDKYSPWLYYEATPNELPQVTFLEDFGRWLDKLEREPGRYREFAKTNLYLKRLMTESHICVYHHPDASRENRYAESFMI